MPNYCENTLWVEGSRSALRRFTQTARNTGDREKTPLYFGGHVPLPGGLDDDEMEAWLGEHWGCQASPDEGSLNLRISGTPSARVLYLSFWTPWTEPRAWFGTVGSTCPELTMRLVWLARESEEAGTMIARDGAVTARDVSLQDQDPDAWLQGEGVSDNGYLPLEPRRLDLPENLAAWPDNETRQAFVQLAASLGLLRDLAHNPVITQGAQPADVWPGLLVKAAARLDIDIGSIEPVPALGAVLSLATAPQEQWWPLIERIVDEGPSAAARGGS